MSSSDNKEFAVAQETAPNESKAAVLTAEDQEKHHAELLAKLEEAGKTLIATTALSDEMKAALRDTLGELEKFKEEVAAREATIFEQSKAIRDRIEEVKDIKYVRVNASISDIFEQTAQDYSNLIKNTLAEIGQNSLYYERYFDTDRKQLVVVDRDDDKALDNYVVREIKMLRKYIKDGRKNLAVLFSRYDYGFNRHMQQLKSIDYYRPA